jgi:hypothetical protein
MGTTVTSDILQVFYGGLLGLGGQVIRIVVGLIKLNRDNTAKALKDLPTTDFSAPRLFSSLLISFIAGALCAFIKGGTITKQTALTFMAVGYSGADTIEGILKPYLPK